MTTSTDEATGVLPARIHRGDVFWMAPDDSRGPVPSYSHPHVVVQDDVFNHSRITTVIVCA
jgi:mRNA interferase MazF